MVDSTIYGRIQQVIEPITPELCLIPLKEIFYFILLPIICIIVLLVLKKTWPEIRDWIHLKLLKRGFIKVIHINTNKQLIERLVKLDGYNSFKFRKKRYSMEKMQDFVLGYKKSVPIFLFDENFIMPLTITKEKMTQAIIDKFDLPDDGKKAMAKISAISMKIEPSILETVYSKKLLSDLYSISGGATEFKQKLMWIGLAIGAILVLYYTGILEGLLGFLGIDLASMTQSK